MFSLHFCSELPVKITISKGIGRIYKYYQRNCPYIYSNTNFIVPPPFDTYIQTQCNSAYDASMGANDVSSAVLDQITNHRANTDSKDNDDSQSYEAPWAEGGGGVRSSSFGDKITTTTTPQLCTLSPPEK